MNSETDADTDTDAYTHTDAKRDTYTDQQEQQQQQQQPEGFSLAATTLSRLPIHLSYAVEPWVNCCFVFPSTCDSLWDSFLANMEDKPTIADLAWQARMPRVPQPGDWFASRGGPGQPCCVEYSAKSPNGERYGALPPNTQMQAKEIDVVRIGASRDWGICIRCDSQLRTGECWVNITRRHLKFAHLNGGQWHSYYQFSEKPWQQWLAHVKHSEIFCVFRFIKPIFCISVYDRWCFSAFCWNQHFRECLSVFHQWCFSAEDGDDWWWLSIKMIDDSLGWWWW